MKFLIIGSGSIANRHYRNLKKIGYKNISFVTNKEKYLISKLRVFKSLPDAIKEFKPDIALICNSTHLHLKAAKICAFHGVHLFVEKPAIHRTKQYKNLVKIINKTKIINMVGFMMRFHPAIKIIEKFMKKQTYQPYYFYSEWGEYLPNWQPSRNYKNSYASNLKTGGGVTLTLCHDLDLMYFFFNNLKKCYNIKNKSIGLNVNCDTTSDFMLKFNKSTVGHVHLDYL